MHSGNINAFTQPTLKAKQDKLTFPASEGANGWGLISDEIIVRRLLHDDPIRVQRILDSPD